MEKWLPAAIAYIERWIEYQMRQSEQPGCVIAIAHRGKPVLERAFGHADLAAGRPLTPRHRFRVASHSKSFTAAGIMKLRERGKLHLDDAVGATSAISIRPSRRRRSHCFPTAPASFATAPMPASGTTAAPS
jgi:Beta-lactamase